MVHIANSLDEPTVNNDLENQVSRSPLENIFGGIFQAYFINARYPLHVLAFLKSVCICLQDIIKIYLNCVMLDDPF